jgi:hypothetical protein
MATSGTTSDRFNCSADPNSSAEQLNDAQRLRQAADHLDAALDAIEYVTRGERDDSFDKHAAYVWTGALYERVRRLDAVVHLIRPDIRGGRPGMCIGQDGKRYPHHPGRIDGDLIQSLRDTGTSMRAIADKLGCSVGTVHRICSTVQGSEFAYPEQLNDCG